MNATQIRMPEHFRDLLDSLAIPTLTRDCYAAWRLNESLDQVQAIIEIKACQIRQTGWASVASPASADQIEWARGTDDARIRREISERVPGTCPGCNSDPCRCLA